MTHQQIKADNKASRWVRGFSIFMAIMSPLAAFAAIRDFRAAPEVGLWELWKLVSALGGTALFVYIAITGRVPRRFNRPLRQRRR